MWLTFAPIPQYTAAFYGVSVSQVDWFSIAYFVVSLVIGFVAIAILDIWGLKVSVSRLLLLFIKLIAVTVAEVKLSVLNFCGTYTECLWHLELGTGTWYTCTVVIKVVKASLRVIAGWWH